MKYPVKVFKVKCDFDGCNNEIPDFEDYKNTCFICHQDFCDDHIHLYKSEGYNDYIGICRNCYDRLSEEFEEHIAKENK